MRLSPKEVFPDRYSRGCRPLFVLAAVLWSFAATAGPQTKLAPSGAPRHENQASNHDPSHLREALDAPTRPEADKARDAFRRPLEVLSFFKIQKGQKVAELMSGEGYYIEILARAVGPQGKVFAHHTSFEYNRFAVPPLSKRLLRPELNNVRRINQDLGDLALPDQLDAVLMVLSYHDTIWQGVDRDKMNRAIFQALKPGGIFGLVDHQAQSGSGSRDVKTLHRIDAAWVKREILTAGFLFDGTSPLLSHPEDQRNYNIFRDFRTRRDRSDRFVFRFRKP